MLLYSGGEICQDLAADPPGRAGRRHQHRIIEPAAAMFEDPEYPSATMDAIAVDAVVVVEKAYARFGN